MLETFGLETNGARKFQGACVNKLGLGGGSFHQNSVSNGEQTLTAQTAVADACEMGSELYKVFSTRKAEIPDHVVSNPD